MMRERDDPVTVVETGRSGGSAGLIGGIVGALVVVGLIIYFVALPLLEGGSRSADVDVTLPNVDVNLPNVQAPAEPGNQ